MQVKQIIVQQRKCKAKSNNKKEKKVLTQQYKRPKNHLQQLTTATALNSPK